ncbi:putative basic proline-rich protein-like [Iris pallida]|uniref:Basic proline-rich protein-like n=1 Tax=Iris pallida TaxID=29817 RepID=A0AAX6F8V8_IRIPA|nr:putative basic proline-rich protein-like [Iris pallida]
MMPFHYLPYFLLKIHHHLRVHIPDTKPKFSPPCHQPDTATPNSNSYLISCPAHR